MIDLTLQGHFAQLLPILLTAMMPTQWFPHVRTYLQESKFKYLFLSSVDLFTIGVGPSRYALLCYCKYTYPSILRCACLLSFLKFAYGGSYESSPPICCQGGRERSLIQSKPGTQINPHRFSIAGVARNLTSAILSFLGEGRTVWIARLHRGGSQNARSAVDGVGGTDSRGGGTSCHRSASANDQGRQTHQHFWRERNSFRLSQGHAVAQRQSAPRAQQVIIIIVLSLSLSLSRSLSLRISPIYLKWFAVLCV